MSLDPFKRPYCPRAWRAEPFSYYGASWQLDAEHADCAAVRLLLERASLPASELLHMGAPAWLLTPYNPADWVQLEVAVPLLGRIVFDSLLGTHGRVWDGSEWAQRDAMGRSVVARYFS